MVNIMYSTTIHQCVIINIVYSYMYYGNLSHGYTQIARHRCGGWATSGPSKVCYLGIYTEIYVQQDVLVPYINIHTVLKTTQ